MSKRSKSKHSQHNPKTSPTKVPSDSKLATYELYDRLLKLEEKHRIVLEALVEPLAEAVRDRDLYAARLKEVGK
jgi:hypothetical protein